MNFIRNGVSYIYELNQAMTDLRKVSNGTNQDYKQFLQTANKSADSINALTTSITQSATEWARLGYNLQQAQSLAKETVLYQNVGDIKSAQDASKALIATIKGFGVEVDIQGKNVQKIVDQYNQIGNNFSISSEGIGQAMMRSASSLHEAGNSIAQSIALATAGNASVQNPEKVGVALKTISMRLRGVSVDGQDATKITAKLENQFDSIGLKLRNDNGSFKSTYQTFSELHKVFNSLSDMQKSGLIQAIGGKRQGNIVSSILSNWTDAQNALKQALNSTGSASKENAIYMDSMLGKVTRLKNQVGEFWQVASNTESLKGLIDIASSLMGDLTGLTKEFGGLQTAVTIASIAILAFKKEMRTSVIASFGLDLKSITKSIEKYTGVTIDARLSTVALEASLTIGLSIAIGAIIGELSKLFAEYQKQKQQQSQFMQQQKQIADNYQNNKNKINDMISSFEKLNQLTSNGTVFTDTKQQQKYYDISNNIAQLMPNLVKVIDQQGNAHLKNADAIKKELTYTQELANLNNAQTITNTQDDLQKMIQDRVNLQREYNFVQNQIKYKSKTGNPSDNSTQVLNQSQIESLQIKALGLNEQLNNGTEKLKEKMKSVTKILVEQKGIKWNDAINKQFQSVINNIDLTSSSVDGLANKSEQFSKIIQFFNDPVKGNAQNLTSVIGRWAKLLESIRNVNSATQNNVQATKQAAKSQQQINTDISDTLKSVDSLASSYQTLNSGQQLSASSLVDLIQKYPQVAEYISKTNDLTLDKGKILKQVAQIQIDQTKQDIQNQLDSVEATKNALEAKKSLYNAFGFNLTDTLYNKQLFDKQSKIFHPTLSKTSMLSKPEQSQLGDANNQITTLKAQLDALKNLSLDKVLGGGSSSSKTPNIIKDINSATKEYNNNLSNLNNKLAESKTRQGKLNKNSLDYVKELKTEISLTKQKGTLTDNQIKKLNTYNSQLKNQMSGISKSSKLYKQLNDQLNNNNQTIDQLKGNYQSLQQSIDQTTQSVQSLIDAQQKEIDKLDGKITSLETKITSQMTKLADQIIQLYKDTYKAIEQGKLTSYQNMEDALKTQLDAQKATHQATMDQLNAELKKYQDVYDAKMKQIDSQESQDQYKKNLQKLQDEKAQIQKQYDVSMLNKDAQNKKRQADLQKQLTDKINQINDFMHQHDITLQKQALQDSLDKQKKEVQSQQDASTTIMNSQQAQYDQQVKNLENLKKQTTQTYNDLINNDAKYNEIRKEVMTGTFDTILSDFGKFKDELSSNSSSIGKILSDNLTVKISDMSTTLNQVSTVMAGKWDLINNTLQNGLVKTLKDLIGQLKDLNHQKFTDLLKQIDILSAAWSGLSDAGKTAAHDAEVKDRKALDQAYGTKSTYNSSTGVWTVTYDGKKIGDTANATDKKALNNWYNSHSDLIGNTGGTQTGTGTGSSGSGNDIGNVGTAPYTTMQQTKNGVTTTAHVGANLLAAWKSNGWTVVSGGSNTGGGSTNTGGGNTSTGSGSASSGNVTLTKNGETVTINLDQIESMGGSLQDWENNGWAEVHHEGGIVGGKTSPKGKFLNSLLNVKSNETMAKLLNGEIVINPHKVDLGSVGARLMSAVKFPELKGNGGGSSPVNHINVNMKIDKLMGGEEGGKVALEFIGNNLIRKGIKLNNV